MGSEQQALQQAIESFWKEQVLDTFCDYIAIPCISRSYTAEADPMGWRAPLDKAASNITAWIEQLGLGATVSRYPQTEEPADPGKAPPVLLVQVPGTAPTGSVLTYGHLDKQAVGPPQDWAKAWNLPPEDPARSPFVPRVSGDHLYGRGTSDDGFATFTVLTALAAMKQESVPFPDVHMVIDFDEESGSQNLPDALTFFSDVIGQPKLCIELDSSIGDYERLWTSRTARGTITGTLSVSMLKTAVHSGDGGGVVPNPLNIMRLLLDRVQDPVTGRVVVPELQAGSIDPRHLDDARRMAGALGRHVIEDFPWLGTPCSFTDDPLEAVLNKTWRAALALTGQAGLPPLSQASNVIVPEMQYQLSMRLPPSVDVHQAQDVLQRTLQANPPFGATVAYDYEGAPIGAGWMDEPRQAWFQDALDDGSRSVFGQPYPAAPYGDGGTVPVLNLMRERFVENQESPAQILATGCAGPGNNEHGANENLDMAYARQLALALALVIQASTTGD